MNAAELNRAAKEEEDHVRDHSNDAVNEKIDRVTEENIGYWAAQPRAAIDARIVQLDREWDIERWLAMNASSLAFLGVLGGLAGRKKALMIPAVVLPFLFQHAVQGWCPPLTLFRALGIRTRKEIDREKYALKVLRGDFADATGSVS